MLKMWSTWLSIFFFDQRFSFHYAKNPPPAILIPFSIRVSVKKSEDFKYIQIASFDNRSVFYILPPNILINCSPGPDSPGRSTPMLAVMGDRALHPHLYCRIVQLAQLPSSWELRKLVRNCKAKNRDHGVTKNPNKTYIEMRWRRENLRRWSFWKHLIVSVKMSRVLEPSCLHGNLILFPFRSSWLFHNFPAYCISHITTLLGSKSLDQASLAISSLPSSFCGPVQTNAGSKGLPMVPIPTPPPSLCLPIIILSTLCQGHYI